MQKLYKNYYTSKIRQMGCTIRQINKTLSEEALDIDNKDAGVVRFYTNTMFTSLIIDVEKLKKVKKKLKEMSYEESEMLTYGHLLIGNKKGFKAGLVR